MLKKDDLFEGFTLGEWEVLPGHGVLRRGEQEERPEPKVFAVLISLACRDGNLVTRDELVNDVWDGRPTTDEPVNRCLSQLRGHLDDRHRPHQYVETLQRRGYRLMKPVKLHKAPEPSATEIAPQPGPSLRLWKIVAAVMALGFLATIALTMRSPDSDPGIHSIALLPIDNLSGDPANQYVVEGIKNVLARRLSEIPDVAIKNTRVQYSEEPSRIAELLDVDSVLSGSVQLQGSTLKVTYLLTRGADNVTIGSGEVDGDVAGVFDLQERLATAVRKELTGSSESGPITSYIPKTDAYNRYLRGLYALEHRGETDNLEKAIELFQESIRMDERFGPAYLSLATAYALMPYYRNSPAIETDRAAIQTVERGIAVDSSIRDAAAAIYGSALHKQKKWSESEAAYRRAISAPLVDSIALNWYSRMLASVGRLDDALAQALTAEAIDPVNSVINSRVAITYTWLGNSEKAHEFFRRAESLGAMGLEEHVLPYVLLLVRDARFQEAQAMTMKAVSSVAGASTDWIRPVFEAFPDRSLRGSALQALDQASSDGTISREAEVTARAILGDTDGAMAVARRLEEPGEIFAMDLLFTPEFQALREHPEFMPLLERLGVVDYWQETGCTFDGQKATCEES
ncbi:MAG: winged helix-turn-helix domain-containing protein [Gammaproteobacteria bacterium]|nr:winged helix-turn-helix domain-containing protein [Gammaproteobacteria bacterium]